MDAVTLTNGTVVSPGYMTGYAKSSNVGDIVVFDAHGNLAHSTVNVDNLATHAQGLKADEADAKFATAAQGAKADTALQHESDPTVPAWAKTATKPQYQWGEILERPMWINSTSKPQYTISEISGAMEVFSSTPYAIQQTSSTKFNSRRVYKMVSNFTLASSNDSDGCYLTIPNFYKLIDIRGVAVNKTSYTRMPIPCYHGGAWFSIRVTDDGQVWCRAVGSAGEFNASEVFLFIEYLQK